MKKLKLFWESLDDMTTVSKRELFLGIVCCALQALDIGHLLSYGHDTLLFLVTALTTAARFYVVTFRLFATRGFTSARIKSASAARQLAFASPCSIRAAHHSSALNPCSAPGTRRCGCRCGCGRRG